MFHCYVGSPTRMYKCKYAIIGDIFQSHILTHLYMQDTSKCFLRSTTITYDIYIYVNPMNIYKHMSWIIYPLVNLNQRSIDWFPPMFISKLYWVCPNPTMQIVDNDHSQGPLHNKNCTFVLLYFYSSSATNIEVQMRYWTPRKINMSPKNGPLEISSSNHRFSWDVLVFFLGGYMFDPVSVYIYKPPSRGGSQNTIWTVCLRITFKYIRMKWW